MVGEARSWRTHVGTSAKEDIDLEDPKPLHRLKFIWVGTRREAVADREADQLEAD